MNTLPNIFDEYKSFSSEGSPAQFNAMLNKYTEQGWTLVTGGMTKRGEWWAIMGKNK